MAENTSIEWTDNTFNCWIGCQLVSDACIGCYAEALNNRHKWADEWGPHGIRHRTSEGNWKQPLKWNRRAEKAGIRETVFCASLADIFDNHKSILPEWRSDLWQLIRDTPWLDWQLLTKRPQNIKRYLPDDWGDGYSNVWLGTTVENQTEADRRIPILLDVPAKVRFLSCEPLLDELKIAHWLRISWRCSYCGGYFGGRHQVTCPNCHKDNGWCGSHKFNNRNIAQSPLSRGQTGQGIDWIICGGESGPKARPMHPDWARSLRDQCAQAGVPFLFKQWGEFGQIDGPMHRVLSAGCFVDNHGTLLAGRGDNITPDILKRVGKKDAGRLLDNIEHNGFPEAQS